MDGKRGTRHERWVQRAEAAYRRMFEGKSQEELVTLTQREDMAVMIGRELAAFLLEEQVAMDSAAEPTEASRACCPKCGQVGMPAARKGEKLVERSVTTRAGDISIHRQRWRCAKCRIVFFSARCSAPSGDGRFQPDGASQGGSPSEQGVVVRGGE
jgi:hypothetical protein